MNKMTEEYKTETLKKNLAEIDSLVGKGNYEYKQNGSKMLIGIKTNKGKIMVCPLCKTVRFSNKPSLPYKNLKNWLKKAGIELQQ